MARGVELSAGGRLLKVAAIELYPSTKVAEWRALLAQAQQELGGVSSGLGVYGDAGWVIAGSLVLGAIERAASSAKVSAGVQTMRRANTLLTNLRLAGEFFPIVNIVNASLPEPETWSSKGIGQSAIDMSKVAFLDKPSVLRQHGKVKADIVNNELWVTSEVDFVNLGLEFVSVKLDDGSDLKVRWSAVETYTLG